MIQMQPNNNTLIYADAMRNIENFGANYAEKFFQLPFFQAENGTRFIAKSTETRINGKDFWKNFYENFTKFLQK